VAAFYDRLVSLNQAVLHRMGGEFRW